MWSKVSWAPANRHLKLVSDFVQRGGHCVAEAASIENCAATLTSLLRGHGLSSSSSCGNGEEISHLGNDWPQAQFEPFLYNSAGLSSPHWTTESPANTPVSESTVQR